MKMSSNVSLWTVTCNMTLAMKAVVDGGKIWVWNSGTDDFDPKLGNGKPDNYQENCSRGDKSALT
jgi:hypothetical protein